MRIIGTLQRWNQAYLYLKSSQGDFYMEYGERFSLQEQVDGIPPLSSFEGLPVEAEVIKYDAPAPAFTHNKKAIYHGECVRGTVKIIKEVLES